MNWPAFILIYIAALAWTYRHEIDERFDAARVRHNPKIQKHQELLSVIVQAATQTKFSILDYLMDVEHMSKSDKAWYELYKQYGNRNHTWQDFRDMFDGDINIAKQTVKNWQTWAQMNAAKGQTDAFIKKINEMMEKLDIESIDQDLDTGIDYAQIIGSGPVPLTNFPELHTEVTQLFNISSQQPGNYCTYNPEISRINRKFRNKSLYSLITKARYIFKMNKYVDLRNANFIVGERIENYYKIIQDNPQILHQIQQEELSQDENFESLSTLLNQSALAHGCTSCGQTVCGMSRGRFAGYSMKSNVIYFNRNVIKQFDQSALLRGVIHEDTHRIDDNNPNFGPLGAQITELARKAILHHPRMYIRVYHKVPMEQSAHFLEPIINAALKQLVSQR